MLGCLLLDRLPLVQDGHLKSLKDSPTQALRSLGMIIFVVGDSGSIYLVYVGVFICMYG